MRIHKIGDLVKVTHTNQVNKLEYIGKILKVEAYGDEYEYILDGMIFTDFEINSIRNLPFFTKLKIRIKHILGML